MTSKALISSGAGAANSIVPDFARYPALPTALLEHGFSLEETTKVLAGNRIRVFHAVKAASG